MNAPDRGASRARLHYARAHVFLKVAPSSEIDQIKADFGELLKLTPEELAAYLYPYHIARAAVFSKGKIEDRDRFAKLDVDKLERELISKTDKFDGSSYERSLVVLPDPASAELAKLSLNDRIRVLMHFVPDPKKKAESAWDFVWSSAGVGWIKLLNKST
jgi:hypothetical protein